MRHTQFLTTLLVYLCINGFAAGQEIAKIPSNYGQLPLFFEENRGQTDARARYLARGANLVTFLTSDGWTASMAGGAVSMHVAGANPRARFVAENATEGVSNYYLGSRAVTGVRQFGAVRVREIRPGIDIAYHGTARELEFDFVIRPGADASALRLRFDGSARPALDENGDIVLKTTSGELRQHKPRVFQDGREVACRYALARNEVRLVLGEYSRAKELVVDPVLSYSTYLGGSVADTITGIAVDSSGFAYVTGVTQSSDFPATNGTFHGTSFSSYTDIFVTKLNAAGTALIYSTIIGGSSTDQANGIAIDSAGSAYITGGTFSSDFPVTTGGSLSYPQQAFVVKLGSTGILAYSTALAGSNGSGTGAAIAVDATGAAYVTGNTSSPNFPVTPGSYKTTYSGGNSDAFVTKLNASGFISYSTFLGGSSTDAGTAIAVDTSGNAFVGGTTSSVNFPTTPGAYQTTAPGAPDGFVVKLDPTGATLLYSTYLGGSGTESLNGLAIDASGNIYLAGSTNSTNFPTTPNAFTSIRPSQFGSGSAFVSKLNTIGTALIYSTYLGGTSSDSATAIAVDSGGAAFVAGGSTSVTTFPTTPGALRTRSFLSEVDMFLVRFGADGASLSYSTLFWPGNTNTFSASIVTGVALDGLGGVYVAGSTTSPTFPTTANAYQSSTPKTGQQSFSNSGAIFKVDFTSPALCNPSFSPPSLTVPGRGGPISFNMSLAAGCPWEAQPDTSAINLNPPTHGVSTGATIALSGSVAQNQSTTFGVTASIRFGSVSEVVNQDPGSCADPTFNPTSITFDSTGGVRDVSLTLPSLCAWSVLSSAPWLTSASSGTGSGTFSVFAGLNNFSQRTATLNVAGKLINVTQTGSTCTATASATPVSFGAQGTTGVVRITPSPSSCSWNAYSTVPWIQLSPNANSGTGTGSAPFIVGPNSGSQPRTGQILIGDQVLAISQLAGPAGTVTGFTQSIFAGGGTASTPGLGDGGPAIGAFLNAPRGLAFDTASSKLYIVDSNSFRIRVVTPDGNINTFAGGGSSTGEGVSATSAQLNTLNGVAVDNTSAVYIDDSGSRVRKVGGSLISTFAGTTTPGLAGDAGPATAAQLKTPLGIAADASGNVFIADNGNNRVRIVNGGTINTFAGGGAVSPGDNGPATQASLGSPNGMAVDAFGNVLIVDSTGSRVRKVSQGTITTVAGGGTGGDGGPATSASLSNPGAIALDPLGDLVFADSNSTRIRMVGLDGKISTVVTSLSIGGLAADLFGNVYASDLSTGLIRKLMPVPAFCSYTVTTPATQPFNGGSLNLSVTAATGCNWNASSDLPWAMITSGSSGIGNGVVQITVSSNAGNPARNGVIAVAGQAVPISQLGPAALSIAKSHSGNFTQGQQNAQYSLVVSNLAGAGATSGTVTVTEAPPAGLTPASMSGTGWTCASSSCSRSDALAGGSSYPAITFTASVSQSATSPQVNQASVSGGGSANATASDSTVILLGPTLSIATFHTGSLAIGQQNATYTITVTNASNAAPTSGTVTVTDTVAPGLTLVSLSGTGWTCAGNTCNRSDSLAGGRSYPPIAAVVNVAADAGSPQTGQVTVSGGGSLSALANDVVSIVLPILQITKSHNASFTQGQQNATYIVVVSNSSSVAATIGAVTVTETLPTGLSLVSMSGSGWNCSVNTCSRSDALAPAASYPAITVTVNVLATSSSFIVNQVSVSGGGSLHPVSASDYTNVFGGLVLLKSHAGTFQQGQQNATYTLTVSNLSSAPASGLVTVTETLPTSLSLVSMTGTGWNCSGNNCTRSDTVAPGLSYSPITVLVNVASNAASPLVNQATLSGGNLSFPQVVTDPTTIGPVQTMSVNRSSLIFATANALTTGAQMVNLSFSGIGLSWTTSTSANVTVQPASGFGNAALSISASGTGSVVITAAGAGNTPITIPVTVTTASGGSPFGSFDTPANNAAGVAGSIAVTGWALDSIEISKVDIWREPIGSEPVAANGLVYIGDAVFIADARPDVQAGYPNVPLNYRAGWGYLLLTNFLPATAGGAMGNGTYKLHAIAHNKAGASSDLGTKTITVDNAHAMKPFGSIDTPAQGGTVSGKSFIDFGWALTQNPSCIPMDGRSITINVDGVNIGTATAYNQYRSDIATAFPGLCNSNGAVGYFALDTTTLANGVHTIAWIVVDNQGHADGIGSRYFNVFNAGTRTALAPDDGPVVAGGVKLRRGYDARAAAKSLKPDRKDTYAVEVEELDRIELDLGAIASGPLPAGSTLRGGVFYWQLAPGFLGDYPLTFSRADGRELRVRVHVRAKRYTAR